MSASEQLMEEIKKMSKEEIIKSLEELRKQKKKENVVFDDITEGIKKELSHHGFSYNRKMGKKLKKKGGEMMSNFNSNR